jgi:hypothetical protein
VLNNLLSNRMIAWDIRGHIEALGIVFVECGLATDQESVAVGAHEDHSPSAESLRILPEKRGGYLLDSRGGLPQMPLCEAPPWPGDSNIVADYSA